MVPRQLIIASIRSLAIKSLTIRSLAIIGLGLLSLPIHAQQHNQDWPIYGGQSENDHFSSLKQINRSNVQKLKTAWAFDTHELNGLQCSPLVVGHVLYGYTPSQKVIALDASTGKLLWTFDSGIPGTQPARGLTYWHDGTDSRLFASVMNFLYALDPATGKPIPSFGENGRVDLRKNLRGDYEQQSIVLTSPGVLYKDLIIVGGRYPETHPAPPGDIRAFDVRTGALRWSFHTIPHPGEPGYETWPKEAWQHSGAANNWAGMVVDQARGIVYAPTGSSVFDFYGGDRIGDDLYANTLLALDAATGTRLWHFQGVHHDIWDRDFPSAPTLFSMTKDGRHIDGLAQTTKQGYLYLFDRVTGKPLFPIVEKPYPASTVPGEKASPTQPMPTVPEPFGRQALTEDMLTNRTPAAHQFALNEFHKVRSAGQFLPLAVDQQTVIFPGFDGGAEWGGSALDPATNVLYVNENEMAWTGGLTATELGGTPGERAYKSYCAVCHGTHREGSPPAFPSLLQLGTRLSDADLAAAIHQGKGRMPGFPMIDGDRLQSLLAYLRTSDSPTNSKGTSAKQELSSHATDATNTAGEASYQKHCAICHGEHREGIPPTFPALLGIGSRMGPVETQALIEQGKGRMPAFKTLPGHSIDAPEMTALLQYLGVTSTSASEEDPESMPYQFTGYRKFLDQDGYPAIAPPWGTLNAIDLKTGKYLWKLPLGEYPELTASGTAITGSENYGGPIVTAGGLVLISATVYDKKIRAFDSKTGTLLWQATLPYAGVATPITYMVDGKQFIVIATGGGRDKKSPSGGEYIAFALPSQSIHIP
jgi:glucose dehydrogenase